MLVDSFGADAQPVKASGFDRLVGQIDSWQQPERNFLIRNVAVRVTFAAASTALSLVGTAYHLAAITVKALPATIQLLTGPFFKSLSWSSVNRDHIQPLSSAIESGITTPWKMIFGEDLASALRSERNAVFYQETAAVEIHIEQPVTPVVPEQDIEAPVEPPKPTVAPSKLVQMATNTGKWCLGAGRNLMIGSGVGVAVQLALQPQETLRNVYGRLWDSSVFAVSPGVIKNFFDQFFDESGMQLPDDIRDTSSILNAECPRDEGFKILSRSVTHIAEQRLDEIVAEYQEKGISISTDVWRKYLPISITYNHIANLMNGFVVVGAGVGEELMYRGGMQDLLLKRFVGAIARKVLPAKYASFVDSKVYAAIRILLTSYAFAISHRANSVFIGEENADLQVKNTFVMGIAFGILKEKYGISSAMAAHMMNNYLALSPFTKIPC